MLAKETADEVADAIIETEASAARTKHRNRIERRYAMVFGDAFAERCVENPDASEAAIRNTQNQWQVVLFLCLWLGGCAALAYFDQRLFSIFFVFAGVGVLRRLIGYYARRHFNALNT